MIRIERILCPVDFSEISQHALDHAAAIANWYEASLTLLYVFPNLPPMELPPLVLEAGDRERLLVAMRKMVDRVPTRVTPEYRVQEADYIQDEIVAQASAIPADLLVLGTHGRTGISYAILGSVAEQVLRRAPCLVLMVPAARLAREVTVPAPVPPTVAEARPCLVCGHRSDDLICESCRARIRGEALQQKREAERPGRRGSPV